MVKIYDLIRWLLTIILITLIWTTHWAVPLTVTLIVLTKEIETMVIKGIIK